MTGQSVRSYLTLMGASWRRLMIRLRLSLSVNGLLIVRSHEQLQ